MSTDTLFVQNLSNAVVTHSKPTKTKGGKGVSISYVNSDKGGPQQFQVSPPSDEIAILFRPTPTGLTEEQALAHNDKFDSVMNRLCQVHTNWHDPKSKTKDGESYYDETGKVTILVAIPEPSYRLGLQSLDSKHTSAMRAHPGWFGNSESSMNGYIEGYKSVMVLAGQEDTADEDKTLVMRLKVRPGPDPKRDTQFIIWDKDTNMPRAGSPDDVTMYSRVIPVVKNSGIYYRGKKECGGMLFCTAMIVFPHVETSGVQTLNIGIPGIDFGSVIASARTPLTHTAIARTNRNSDGAEDMDVGDTAFSDADVDSKTVISAAPWSVNSGPTPAVSDPLFP